MPVFIEVEEKTRDGKHTHKTINTVMIAFFYPTASGGTAVIGPGILIELDEPYSEFRDRLRLALQEKGLYVYSKA